MARSVGLFEDTDLSEKSNSILPIALEALTDVRYVSNHDLI